MGETTDTVRYGFGLYPFALLTMVGLFLVQYGLQLLGAIPGMQLNTLTSILLLLVFQIGGGIIALAGFFGGLRQVIKDANE